MPGRICIEKCALVLSVTRAFTGKSLKMPVMRLPPTSGSAIQEIHHNVEVSLERGDVRRRPPVPVCLADVGPIAHKQFDHTKVSKETTVRQESLTVLVVSIDERKTGGSDLEEERL